MEFAKSLICQLMSEVPENIEQLEMSQAERFQGGLPSRQQM